MTPIDTQGRPAGRFNIIDVAVIAAIVIAIPVSYAAYLLLRSPAPALLEVLPGTMVHGTDTQVEIHGQNFRPYMRVSFGDKQGPAFYFVSPTVAVVPLPPAIAPGAYDVILYDYMREVSRVKGGLTITPALPPRTATLRATGAFTEISDAWAPQIVVGYKIGPEPLLVVREVGAAVAARARIATAPATAIEVAASGGRELPATVDVVCTLQVAPDGAQRCLFGGVAVAPGHLITLPVFAGAKFRIDRLDAPQ